MQYKFRETDLIAIGWNFVKEMKDSIFQIIRNVMYSNYNEVVNAPLGTFVKKLLNSHTNCGAYERNY